MTPGEFNSVREILVHRMSGLQITPMECGSFQMVSPDRDRWWKVSLSPEGGAYLYHWSRQGWVAPLVLYPNYLQTIHFLCAEWNRLARRVSMGPTLEEEFFGRAQ